MTAAPPPIDLAARLQAAGAAHFASLDAACLALWHVLGGIVQANTRVAVEHEAVFSAIGFEAQGSFAETLDVLHAKVTPVALAIVEDALHIAWARYVGDLKTAEAAIVQVMNILRAAIDDAERLRDGRYIETFRQEH